MRGQLVMHQCLHHVYTADLIKVDIDNCQMCNTSDKRMMEIITVLHANVKDITLL